MARADAVPASELLLSAVTIPERETAALRLCRRDKAQGELIRQWIETRVLPAFAGRILPVDAAVARRCANFDVPSPRPCRDSLIAATAAVHDLIVATRNRGDFRTIGVAVANPGE